MFPCMCAAQVDISDKPNNAPCQYLRHLPVVDKADCYWQEGAVFFRLDANTTGMLLVTRRITAQMVEASGVGTVYKTV